MESPSLYSFTALDIQLLSCSYSICSKSGRVDGRARLNVVLALHKLIEFVFNIRRSTCQLTNTGLDLSLF